MDIDSENSNDEYNHNEYDKSKTIGIDFEITPPEPGNSHALSDLTPSELVSFTPKALKLIKNGMELPAHIRREAELRATIQGLEDAAGKVPGYLQRIDELEATDVAQAAEAQKQRDRADDALETSANMVENNNILLVEIRRLRKTVADLEQANPTSETRLEDNSTVLLLEIQNLRRENAELQQRLEYYMLSRPTETRDRSKSPDKTHGRQPDLNSINVRTETSGLVKRTEASQSKFSSYNSTQEEQSVTDWLPSPAQEELSPLSAQILRSDLDNVPSPTDRE
jgi:hypothetical protein